MDKKDKELEDFQGRRVLATLGIIVSVMVVIIVVATVLSSVPAKELEERAVLYIDEVFFLYSGSNSESEKVTIDVTTFITNKGTEDAKDVQIIAFAIDDDSNLAMDKSTFTVGDIPKENTKPSEFSITMPDSNSYNIRLIILESGKLSIKGTGTVHLDKDYGGHGTRFSPDNSGNGESGIEFIEKEGSYSVGLIYLMLLFLICIIIIVAVVIKKSSKPIKSSKIVYPSDENNAGEMGQDDLIRFPVTDMEEVLPEDPEDKFQAAEIEEG